MWWRKSPYKIAKTKVFGHNFNKTRQRLSDLPQRAQTWIWLERMFLRPVSKLTNIHQNHVWGTLASFVKIINKNLSFGNFIKGFPPQRNKIRSFKIRQIFFRGLFYTLKAFKLHYSLPNLRLISLKWKFLLLKLSTFLNIFIIGLYKGIKSLKYYSFIKLDLLSNLI